MNGYKLDAQSATMPNAGEVVTPTGGNPRLFFSVTNDSYTRRRNLSAYRTNNEFFIGTANAGNVALVNTIINIALDTNSMSNHLQKCYFEWISNGRIMHPTTGYVSALDESLWNQMNTEIETYLANIPAATPTIGVFPVFNARIRNPGVGAPSVGDTMHLSSSGAPQFTRETIRLIQGVALPDISQLYLEEMAPGDFLLKFGFADEIGVRFNPLLAPLSSITDEPHNLLAIGAPGTGKSSELDARAERLVIRSGGTRDENIFPISFSPSTSYGKFVGEYRPVMAYEVPAGTFTTAGAPPPSATAPIPGIEEYSNMSYSQIPLPGKPKVNYEFVPGVFLRSYLMAINNPRQKVVLLIDEINRGDIFEVLGEVFQLMERKTSPAPQSGRYSLPLSPEAMVYLKTDQIEIPDNLYLWATMNPNDSSVQVIDSAFIRRWTVEYFGINSGSPNRLANLPVIGTTWEALRSAINSELTAADIDEGELIGKWFITEQDGRSWKRFYSKFVFHLANYVVRDELEVLFEHSTVQDIMSQCNRGRNPFKQEIRDILNPPPTATTTPAALPAPSAAAPPAPSNTTNTSATSTDDTGQNI